MQVEVRVVRKYNPAFPWQEQYLALILDEAGVVLKQATGTTEAGARRQLLGLVRQEITAHG